MKKFIGKIPQSAKEIKNIRILALCGIMGALAIVLRAASIDIGNFIRIGFSTLPERVVDFAAGPVIGGILGGLLDVLKFLIKPTGAFFPGFTISAIISGIIYGFILYKNPISIPRIIIAEVIEKVLIDCLLNTYWLSILYGTPFWATLLDGRLVSKMAQLPVDIILVYMILKVVEKMLAQLKMTSGKNKQ